MYQYVNNATVQPYRSFCSDKMNQIKQLLYHDYDIVASFSLIGSGAKNLVTQNEAASFDLDYNLEIQSHTIEYLDAKKLKTIVMNMLNKILSNQNCPFSDSQDSTAVITSRWIDKNKLKFSFDIAILAKNVNGSLCRMIHDKHDERYFWTEVPDSQEVFSKMELLKKNGWWSEIRNLYLRKKNMYLQRNDKNHPSFVVFVETVNEVYDCAIARR